MTRYCDQNSTKDSIDSRLKNIESLKENIFRIEEKNYKENLKNNSFLGKNYILKSEICKLQMLSSNDINSEKHYLNNKYNAIANYFFNNHIIYQNKNDDINGIKDIDEKIRQNSPGEDFPKIHQNTIYFCNSNNMLKSNNENPNKDNSNFNNDSKMTTINQINNYVTNNIIKINNFYPNENDINLKIQNHNKVNINPITLIKDKFGCIMMKNKILSDPNYANEILFPQIKTNLKDLCCDNFGNYFLQSYLDIITFDNLNTFLNSLNDNFTEICLSPYGTRIIQKIIDKIAFTPILINKFTFILNNKDFKTICNSQYGNHVVQRFLSALHSSEYTNIIYNNIYKNFLEFANNKHGVFIVQKCISEGNEIQRKIIYQLIVDYFFPVIENEFGNYLIQFILLNKKIMEQTFHEILPIILKLEENIINLCFSKYSANVIEKCFEQSENIIRNHILDFLFKYHSNRVIDIMFNKYGIYIIIKAIKSQNGKYKNNLINIFNNSSRELKYIINSNLSNCKSILKIIHKYKELDDVYKIIVNNIVNIEK